MSSLFLSAGLALIAIALMRFTVEQWAPVQPAAPLRHGLLNIGATLCWLGLNALIGPLLVYAISAAVNGLGGGWIALPARGWPMLLSALLYIFVADAGEYGFHRLQHRTPWLWSIHSLHHSDRQVDASTAGLNHWSAMIMRMAFVALPLGVLFKAPTAVSLIYMASTFHVYFIHANTRIHFGSLSWLLSSPSYHRLHHSVEQRHHDANFAFIFPIYDVLLGTYRPARAGEWPQTGLDTGEEAKTLVEVLAWPMRHALRRRQAAQLAGAIRASE
jgi:sterol desaturase/sphingolipid hydroxylase (fatty acid hydroxylase superfamily)